MDEIQVRPSSKKKTPSLLKRNQAKRRKLSSLPATKGTTPPSRDEVDLRDADGGESESETEL